MLRLQPWNAIKTLFGFTPTGHGPDQVQPMGLQQLSRGLFVYGRDSVSNWFKDKMQLAVERFQKYKEYDDMAADDIVAGVVEIYAADATQPDISTGRVIWAESEDPETEQFCNDLLTRVRADSDAFAIAQEISKYGDAFAGVINSRRPDGTPGQIMRLVPCPPYAISRIEDEYNRLSGWCMAPIEQLGAAAGSANPFDVAKGVPTDPPWSFIHWRLMGKNRFGMYGTSMLDGARKPYKRLMMMEQALIIYRLRRAPDRFVYKLKGMGGMSPEDRRKAMDRIRQEMRKKFLYNKANQDVRQEIEPLGFDEDIIVDDESVAVERMAGTVQSNQTMDIEYMRKRFFGTLKIPPDYLGFTDSGKGVNIGATPLSLQDINFARSEKRLQQAVMEGYSLLCQIDMCWAGIDPRAPRSKFTMHMNPVSALDEQQRAELEKVRLDTITTLQSLGNDLGVESDEWTAYLLQRSGIPSHLLRGSAARKDSGILKGRVAVHEQLAESTIKRIDTLVRERIGAAPEKGKALLEALVTLHRVYRPESGPNTYMSSQSELMFGTESDGLSRLTPAAIVKANANTLTEGYKKARVSVTGLLEKRCQELCAEYDKRIADEQRKAANAPAMDEDTHCIVADWSDLGGAK